MEYKTRDQLIGLATVADAPPVPLTRAERLKRWAEVLETHPKRRLNSLGEIEFKAPDEQKTMRADDSPLTVAFQDPLLRQAGLSSDRLGDAVAFFELSEGEAHQLLCSCMNGISMSASRTARRVRHMSRWKPRTEIAVWTAAGAILMSTPLLLHLLR